MNFSCPTGSQELAFAWGPPWTTSWSGNCTPTPSRLRKCWTLTRGSVKGSGRPWKTCPPTRSARMDTCRNGWKITGRQSRNTATCHIFTDCTPETRLPLRPHPILPMPAGPPWNVAGTGEQAGHAPGKSISGPAWVTETGPIAC